MARDANLARQDHAFTDGSGPGKPNLRAKQRIRTHRRPMAHLDKVINLGPGLDAGLPDRGPVDARIGLHLDGIFKNRRPGLNDLVPATIRLTGKAEAVGSNNGSVLQNNIIAKVTVLPDNGVGMGEQIVARLRVGIEHDVQ